MSQIKNTTNKSDRYPDDLYFPKTNEFLERGASGKFGFYDKEPKFSINGYIQDAIDTGKITVPIDTDINIGTNTYFVATTGDDSTGEVGNLHKPFRTIEGANAALTIPSSSIVVILPGVYTTSAQYPIQKDVKYVFMAGAKFTFSNYLVDDSTLDSSSKIMIYGEGDFILYQPLINVYADIDPIAEFHFYGNFVYSTAGGVFPTDGFAQKYNMKLFFHYHDDNYGFWRAYSPLTEITNCVTNIDIEFVQHDQESTHNRPYWMPQMDSGANFHDNVTNIRIGSFYYNRNPSNTSRASLGLWMWGRKDGGTDNTYNLTIDNLYAPAIAQDSYTSSNTNVIFTFGVQSEDSFRANGNVYNTNINNAYIQNLGFVNFYSANAATANTTIKFNVNNLKSNVARIMYGNSLPATNKVIFSGNYIVEAPVMEAFSLQGNFAAEFYIENAKINNNGSHGVVAARPTPDMTLRNSVLINDGVLPAIRSTLGIPIEAKLMNVYTNTLLNDSNVTELITPLVQDTNVK